MTPADVADLLDGLAAMAPAMPEAACKGSSGWDGHLDGETPKDTWARYRTARRACRLCPELSACRRWFDSLDDPPHGVTAGIIVSAVRGAYPKWARTA